MAIEREQFWEYAEKDVATVLEAHGESGSDAEDVFDEYIADSESKKRIEEAVLVYFDDGGVCHYDDECMAALSMIEDILMEKEVIPPTNDKEFNVE